MSSGKRSSGSSGRGQGRGSLLWDAENPGGRSTTRSGTTRTSVVAGQRRESGARFSTRDFSVDQSVNLMSGDYQPASVTRTHSGSGRTGTVRSSITGLFRAETGMPGRSPTGRPFDEFDASAATESEEYLGNIRRRRLNPLVAAVIDCCDSVGCGGKVSLGCVVFGIALLAYGIYALVQTNPHDLKQINAVKKIIIDSNVTPASVFKSAGNNPQKQALVWIAAEDEASLPKAHEALLERYILAVFYFGSKPDKWINSNQWMSAAGHCSWHGIQCVAREDETEESGISKTYDDDDHITAISLASNGMDGTIPAEFGKLSNTLTLDLSDNDIKGELPEFHQNLRYILCGKNALAGTIPESITQLTNLHGLDLSMNRLEGKLPDNFGDLEELRSLMLSENLFSGSFPEIPKMLKMTKLHVDDNLFTGSLPTYIEEFTRLTELAISKNKLEGAFPEETLKSLNKLEVLRMGDNRFTGTMPDMFDRIHRLRDLHMNNNKLSGSIPDSLGHLSAMTILRLDNNRLTGTIPLDIVIMADMEVIALNDNLFTGTIPQGFGFLDDVHYLSLKNNQLTGTIPPGLGGLFRLLDLHLQNNNLTGEIPTQLGQLDLLTKLSLENNDFVGVTMPDEVCQLVSQGDLSALSSDCNKADKVSCDCCQVCFPLL